MRKYIIALMILVIASCSKNNQVVEHVSTGNVYSQQDIINSKVGSNSQLIFNSEGASGYAQVNSKWINQFDARWKQEISSKGLTWNTKFDCVYYSILCLGTAGSEFLVDQNATNPNLQAQGLAVFLVEYVPDGSAYLAAHAIIMFDTEKGSIYYDPQIGIVNLSKTEVDSIFKLEIF